MRRKQTPEQIATGVVIDALVDVGVRHEVAGMMAYPKKAWVADEDKDAAYTGSEDQLQQQLDDMLTALGIWYLRFPNGFFRWIKMNAPPGIQRFFFGIFGGIPDSLPMIRVSEKYMLCCPIEAKSKHGARHGKQKHWESKGIPFQISRSPERSIAIVERFQADAAVVRGLFEAKQLNEIK